MTSFRAATVLLFAALFVASWTWGFYAWFRMVGNRAPGVQASDLWLLDDEFLTEAGRRWRGHSIRWLIVGAVFGIVAALLW